MDRRRRESEGKVKIEGYMSVSDEEAHQREAKMSHHGSVFVNKGKLTKGIKCKLEMEVKLRM